MQADVFVALSLPSQGGDVVGDSRAVDDGAMPVDAASASISTTAMVEVVVSVEQRVL